MFLKLKLKIALVVASLWLLLPTGVKAQVNADQMMRVGMNAIYFNDYVLSIQYFNQAIAAKPYLAQPYFYRAIAKLNLDDFMGAEEDATLAIERNPFIADAFEVRGVARQNQGDAAGAIADYDSALDLMPHNRQLLFNKALAQEEIGKNDSAMVTFNTLLQHYPGYENGYLGRARLLLEVTDTVAAAADIDKALEINKNLPGAYVLKADIAAHSHRDFSTASEMLSEAIKLQPREPGLYINRAFMRYNLDDYPGAFSDYDYAIQLDPYNSAALFNRGLMRMEVNDNDNAISDFSRALELDPDDYRSKYNRGYLYSMTGHYKEALSDINSLLEAFPGLPEAYYMRSSVYRSLGDMARAEKDYNKGLQLSKNLPSAAEENVKKGMANGDNPSKSSVEGDASSPGDGMDPRAVAKRFTALRTIEHPVDMEEDYNNKNIRGRVQDRSRKIELEPMFVLTYYSAPTELDNNSRYAKEVDDLNATRTLRFVVQITNRPPTLSDDNVINNHFRSVEYYNSYLSTHQPRAVDYFGRAMDFMVLCNFEAAIADLNRTIALTPDFALAYFQRANARTNALHVGALDANADPKIEARAILSDLDRAIELAPRLSYAYYNKGNVLVMLNDLQGAMAAYNKAIELQPELGEAYYNRGYVYFQLGDRQNGITNLSKAGELGVVPSYNLIKRMK